MPLKKCVKDGKAGFQWGESGHCYNGPDQGENKRKAIVQATTFESKTNLERMLKHSKGAFIDYEGVEMMRRALAEKYPRGYLDSFTQSVAKFFSKADDPEEDLAEAAPILVRNGGLQVPDRAEVSDDMSDDEAEAETYDPSKPSPYSDGSPARSDEDEVEPGGEYSNDGFRPHNGVRDGSPADTDDLFKIKKDDASSNPMPRPQPKIDSSPVGASLDDHTLDKTRTLIPNYNRQASPETDPSRKVPNYEPPDRSEMSGENDENYSEASLADQEHLEDMAYIGIAFLSSDQRSHIPLEDFADPDRRAYPCTTQKQVMSALKLIHFSDKPSMVKKNIIKIARRKNFSLPSHLTHDDAFVV